MLKPIQAAAAVFQNGNQNDSNDSGGRSGSQGSRSFCIPHVDAQLSFIPTCDAHVGVQEHDIKGRGPAASCKHHASIVRKGAASHRKGNRARVCPSEGCSAHTTHRTVNDRAAA